MTNFTNLFTSLLAAGNLSRLAQTLADALTSRSPNACKAAAKFLDAIHGPSDAAHQLWADLDGTVTGLLQAS